MHNIIILCYIIYVLYHMYYTFVMYTQREHVQMCWLESLKALTPSNIFRGTPSFHVMDDVVGHAVIA